MMRPQKSIGGLVWNAPYKRGDARRVEDLQRDLNVHSLLQNWVRPHWGLSNKATPAMMMGYCDRPFSTHELLTIQDFHHITL